MVAKFKVIRQYNSWSCYACVAAMITGETLEDVIKEVGHDGSEKVDWSLHPEKHRGFTLEEINLYLATRFYTLGCVCADVSGQTAKITKEYSHLIINIPFDIPAMILVKSTLFDDGHHCLYWNGKQAFDPHHDDDVDLANYELAEWWPVIKFNKYSKPKGK